MIDIDFASKKLQKQFNEEKTMLTAFGQQRAKRIKVVMTALRAAPNLGVFAPPYSPPHRCRELTGKRKGTLSLDLDGPYRLIVQPLYSPRVRFRFVECVNPGARQGGKAQLYD